MTVSEIIVGLGYDFLPLVSIGFFVILFSSYVKISTVLSILRSGLGAFSIPSAMVTGSLALVLSFFVMYPYINEAASSIDRVVSSSGSVNSSVRVKALGEAGKSWKKFLLKHSDPEVISELATIANKIDESAETKVADSLDTKELRDWRILAPAFYLSELREAFAIGLSLFLPFLVVDLCVAHILVALGVNKVDPSMVSLPLKLLLFVMLDGWALIAGNLLSSYGG